MTASTEERVTITLTYRGRRLNKTGKMLQVFHVPENPDTVLTYSKVKASIIGGVYTVDANDATGSTIFPASMTYAGMDEDTTLAQREQWSAEDRAEATRHEANAREKRVAKDGDPFAASLATLRQQYRKTIGHSKRAALLAAIIEEVTR